MLTMRLQKKGIASFLGRPNEHISKFGLMGRMEVDFRLFDQERLILGEPALHDNG